MYELPEYPNGQRHARSPNRKLVFEALSSINWSPLYSMDSCNDKFHYFSFIVNGIVDLYLPMKRIKSDSSDKPWVTPEIKRLITKRQATWNSGNNIMFRLYRNKVNTLCKRARSRFYNSNVADCFESNLHKWWSNIKNIAGLGATKNVSTILYNGQSYSGSVLQSWSNVLGTPYNFHIFIVFFGEGRLNPIYFLTSPPPPPFHPYSVLFWGTFST